MGEALTNPPPPSEQTNSSLSFSVSSNLFALPAFFSPGVGFQLTVCRRKRECAHVQLERMMANLSGRCGIPTFRRNHGARTVATYWPPSRPHGVTVFQKLETGFQDGALSEPKVFAARDFRDLEPLERDRFPARSRRAFHLQCVGQGHRVLAWV